MLHFGVLRALFARRAVGVSVFTLVYFFADSQIVGMSQRCEDLMRAFAMTWMFCFSSVVYD